MTHYHFIGIGGTGLSPIAQIFLEQGHLVSGSDLSLSTLANDLQKKGARVSIGHDAKNIEGAEVVIRSSAVKDDNIEVVAAKNAGLPVLKRADLMDELTRNKKVLAVAGTHGKTTTTGMLAWALTYFGEDPSYIIGGVSKNLKSNAHAGKGQYFVIEADEYDGMFLGLNPFLLVVTNMEHDHPDFYPTMEEYRAAFQKLVSLISVGGYLLANDDNPNSRKLLNVVPKEIQAFSYGVKPKADYQADSIRQVERIGVQFSARLVGPTRLENIQLKIPGVHNAVNALAVLAAIQILNMPLEKCKEALQEFLGTNRRFDILGEASNITIINDYAHHPTEIRATLAAARQQFQGRHIWAVWQPHTYSRILALLEEFANAFCDSDHVIVTEIYQAREQKRDLSAADIVPSIHHADVKFMADFQTIVEYLCKSLQAGDVLLVLSAGNADQISSQVLECLSQKRNK